VTLEVYRHLFAAVADEMGVTLRRTASSPNIKERRDYSCAVFDRSGCMVAQGDDMPVHLGSMPASVAAAISEIGPGAGDLVILNDPFRGGTHLPDITMVAPFCPGEDGRPLFYVANRAHHADIGGSEPGSMPLARDLIQEGLVIPPVHWRRNGEPVSETRRLLLANVRTPEERLGDLAAQEASVGIGLRRLEEMYRRRQQEMVIYAGHLLDRAERSMRALLAGLPDGEARFSDVMDDDGLGSGPLQICLSLEIHGDTVTADFAGTAAAAEGCVNAVPAIVHSAVSYAFRCLLPKGVPQNAGLDRPLQVRLPEGSLLNPPAGSAVAAGNVETSQRLVDVVLGALQSFAPERIPAASQGTMNNLALGGRRPGTGEPFTYYETMAGGHGGRPDGPGMSARHSHMTNSLNTPIEALEHAIPVRVERYALRAGSGGAGRHRGGDGLVRTLRFLVDTDVTVLSDRRLHAPYGLAGGEPGECGHNLLQQKEGSQDGPGKFTRRFRAGEALTIETPGGGGWGESE
jgi:N-methylhydantoinase B